MCVCVYIVGVCEAWASPFGQRQMVGVVPLRGGGLTDPHFASVRVNVHDCNCSTQAETTVLTLLHVTLTFSKKLF